MPVLNKQPTMADFQQFIEQICLDRGWDKRTVVEKMLFLTEEVGELARSIRNDAGIYGHEKPTSTDHIAEELVDILNYVLDISNMYQIDLESAFRKKWKINSKRRWHGSYGEQSSIKTVTP